jgi:hypothetical protein
MAITKHLGVGTFADVAWHQSRWWCAWQSGPNLHLVSLDPGTLNEVSWTSWAIGEPGAFPRLMSWVSRLWLAHREAMEPYRIVVREVGTSHVEILSPGHGSDPVALGVGDVAWQATGAPEWQVWRKPLIGTEPSRFVRQGRPTGLSRALADGAVKTVDEDRLELAGYTRPCWAGDLVVAEGKNLGTYARLIDGRELVVWPGEEAVTPRCAWDGGDRFGIATWGAREGVRFAEVARAEFKVPSAEPQPERLPEGTEIDLFPYLVGDASTWPRHGDHYMYQVWDGRNLTFLKFGPVAEGSTLGDNWERLVLDGDQFYLREDRSQSGAGIYSFHPGTAYARRMTVGQWIDVPDNILQRYEKGTCRVIDQHPLPYRIGLVEAWTHFDCGGDLGIRDVVKCSYDPGNRNDTIEHFWYARGAGWFRWQEQRQDDPTRTHTQSFNRIGGVPLTPTQGCWRRDLVPWPPSTPKPPVPKPPDPPKPDPTPEPVKMTTFKTSDGTHYLCAEGGGGREIVANRTEPGAWETFEVVKVDATHVALKASNGQFVCAENGGGRELVANRSDVGAWETFEVVPVDGGIALRTSGGQFVCAEEGGGGVVVANRSAAGAWETFSTSVPLLSGGGGHVGGGPVDPGVGGSLSLLRVAGRYFANDAGLFDYRELSAFGAYARYLQGRHDQLSQLASVSRVHKVTSWRVILTLSGDFWQNIGTPCGPSIAGFYDHLVPFTRWCASQGLYVRYCLIGGIEEFGGNPVDRRDDFRAPVRERAYAYLRRVVTTLAGEPNVLWNVANEWNQIGLRDSFDHVVEMGRIVKSIAPQHILNLSETNGPIADDPMWVREPADFVDAHLDRRIGMAGFEWVKRSSESGVVDNGKMPFLSGEPINFGTPAPGRPDDCERSPAVAFCYGATSRVKRYLTNFHYHGGLTADVPDGDTQACLDGWRRGLDAIPMGFPGGWCNGHHGCSPWEIDNFPTSDSVDGHRGPVRIFGLSGSDGYIGVSVREVSGHRPRARRDVQEVDRIEHGGFASAVYRA